MLSIKVEDIPNNEELYGLFRNDFYSDAYNKVITFEWNNGHIHMRLSKWNRLPNYKKDLVYSMGENK